jgi:hypothetical protein
MRRGGLIGGFWLRRSITPASRSNACCVYTLVWFRRSEPQSAAA